MEDVTDKLYSDAKEDEDAHQESRPSTMTTKKKGKNTLQISPCK
jgi:hypothetical protein